MIKIKTYIIIMLIYLIAFISLKTNLNLFYPFYLLKDLLYYPVNANTDDFKMHDDLYNGILIEQEKEFQELKKVHDLSSTLTEFTPVTSLVINRNKMYWFNTITINKGSNKGIEEDMAVISSSGLIGKINKVNHYTSEVRLITTSDINSKISVLIKMGDETIYGIMAGFNSEENVLKVTSTNKQIEVLEGSFVYTSGMGGIFPSGILIGKVKNTSSDKYNVSKIINVTPASDFNNLKFVTVLKRK